MLKNYVRTLRPNKQDVLRLKKKHTSSKKRLEVGKENQNLEAKYCM